MFSSAQVRIQYLEVLEVGVISSLHDGILPSDVALLWIIAGLPWSVMLEVVDNMKLGSLK